MHLGVEGSRVRRGALLRLPPHQRRVFAGGQPRPPRRGGHARRVASAGLPRTRRGRRCRSPGSRLGLLLAAAQFALLLTWHGSLLYLAIANGLLLAAASAALACAAGLAPIVFFSPSALGGPFSSIA